MNDTQLASCLDFLKAWMFVVRCLVCLKVERWLEKCLDQKGTGTLLVDEWVSLKASLKDWMSLVKCLD